MYGPISPSFWVIAENAFSSNWSALSMRGTETTNVVIHRDFSTFSSHRVFETELLFVTIRKNV